MSLISQKKFRQIKRFKDSDSKYRFIHTVDLHYRNLESAKNLVIETIQEYYITEITHIRFITGRGNHVNSNGERATLYKNFPNWMTDIAIDHLIERYEQGNGHYLVILKKSYHITVPTVDLQHQKSSSAKNFVIKAIQEFHSKEILIIKFITGTSMFHKNFSKLISNIMINHLIKFYIQYDGYYYVSLKSSDQLEKEIMDTFLDINVIKQEALNGDVEAQCILGLMYFDGEGVKKDIREALKWLTISAENGNIKSQLLVGQLYFDGIGINKKGRYATAFNWFCMAAEQGDVYAQLIVGHILYEGKGVAKNVKEAFKWFEKAAKQNNVNAQLIVNRMNSNGEGKGA